MKKLILLFIICSFSWPQSFAGEIHLHDEMRKIKPRMLYASDGKNHPVSSLYDFKKASIELDGKACQKRYEGTFKKYVKVQGWIALAYMNCLPELELSLLNKRLKEWTGTDLWDSSPWQPALKEAVLRSAMSHLKAKGVSSSVEVTKLLEWLGHHSDWLSREQLAQVRLKRSELAQAAKRLEEARFHLELAQELDPRLRESKPLKSLEPGFFTYEKSLKSELAAISGSTKKWPQALLEEAMAIHPNLLIELAQQAHRRGEYAEVLLVLQPFFERSALERKNLPSHYLTPLWLAGRSASFLGQYEKAASYFELLAKYFSGTPEASEGLFRRGLSFYRMQDWESASLAFQRTLMESGEKYHLGAKYWLVRVLEKQKKKEEAARMAQELIQRYPWSYYGLRLQAELAGVNEQGRWVWKSPSFKDVDTTLSDKLWLEGHEKESFERVKILVANGMQEEAHFEVKTFAYSFRPETHAYLSRLFQKMGLYLPAIMQLNSAQEKDPVYLNIESVRGTFPRPFYENFQEEAKKTQLPVELLLSLTRQESGFNSRALSSAQAMGLMQLIPPTAKEVAQKLKLNMKNPQEAFRPSWNIQMGSFYIAEVIRQFNGTVPLGLAGYNAGPHKVKKWLELRAEVRNVVGTKSSDPDLEIWFDELPWSETSFYVKAILRNFAIYRILSTSDLGRGVDFGPVWWQ